MNFKKILTLLISLILFIGTPSGFAEDEAASQITVYLTVSNQGILEKANDQSIMLNKPVTVTDLNNDGYFFVDEALSAAHNTYNSADGYSCPRGAVTKLWGVETGNTLFFVNDTGLSMGAKYDTVSDGDRIVASINKDSQYYSDWYSYFDETSKSVEVGEEFTLTLKGYWGMAYLPEDMTPAPLSQISVGLWQTGSFLTLEEKITDENGQVTLSFDEAGEYFVSVDGTVRDTVTDWSSGGTTLDFDCPIIASGCKITVTSPPSIYPDEVASYLPAPGQFVNVEAYQNPNVTLDASGMITIGAFGGNVVYKYNEPIKNDTKNPYGIDFIVMGNCFTNQDGTTSSAAAEPASVLVSADGESWYELAGSEYYNKETKHNTTITYTNPDPDFTEAQNISWTDSVGNSGEITTNSFHTQPYFPNPAYYSVYQEGAGKNNTYSAQSLCVSGAKISSGFYPFGYADSHAQNTQLNNSAQNPYIQNHDAVYNGDGFDIAWAVDSDKNPVILDEISYIKIYNPVFEYSETSGEKSPEISTVMRALADEAAVGTTSALTSLAINGEEILLDEDETTLNIDAKNASELIITPLAANESANIYVGNQRVASGSSTSAMPTVSKTRIIVQEGEKEPLIYTLNFTNINENTDNTDIPPSGDDSETVNTIQVSFTLTGDTHHYNIETNSYTSSHTDPEWISHCTVDIPEGSTVKYLTHLMLDNAELDYNADNSYISEINGLSEFDNGPYSGWMYKVNSELAMEGYTTLILSSGDSVQWFYCDNMNDLFEEGDDFVGDDYTDDDIDNSTTGTTTVSPSTPVIPPVLDDTQKSDKLTLMTDINKDAWYYDAVAYVVENNLFNGVSDTEFSPNTNMTRAMVVTVLHRLAAPETTPSDISFNDISANSYYYDAVCWAAQNNIVSGISNSQFAPDNNITREQLAVILYRYAKLTGLDTVKTTELSDFADNNKISPWATEALGWAVASELIGGVSDYELSPSSPATRAQIAQILMRFSKLKD